MTKTIISILATLTLIGCGGSNSHKTYTKPTLVHGANPNQYWGFIIPSEHYVQVFKLNSDKSAFYLDGNKVARVGSYSIIDNGESFTINPLGTYRFKGEWKYQSFAKAICAFSMHNGSYGFLCQLGSWANYKSIDYNQEDRLILFEDSIF